MVHPPAEGPVLQATTAVGGHGETAVREGESYDGSRSEMRRFIVASY